MLREGKPLSSKEDTLATSSSIAQLVLANTTNQEEAARAAETLIEAGILDQRTLCGFPVEWIRAKQSGSWRVAAWAASECMDAKEQRRLFDSARSKGVQRAIAGSWWCDKENLEYFYEEAVRTGDTGLADALDERKFVSGLMDSVEWILEALADGSWREDDDVSWMIGRVSKEQWLDDATVDRLAGAIIASGWTDEICGLILQKAKGVGALSSCGFSFEEMIAGIDVSSDLAVEVTQLLEGILGSPLVGELVDVALARFLNEKANVADAISWCSEIDGAWFSKDALEFLFDKPAWIGALVRNGLDDEDFSRLLRDAESGSLRSLATKILMRRERVCLILRELCERGTRDLDVTETNNFLRELSGGRGADKMGRISEDERRDLFSLLSDEATVSWVSGALAVVPSMEELEEALERVDRSAWERQSWSYRVAVMNDYNKEYLLRAPYVLDCVVGRYRPFSGGEDPFEKFIWEYLSTCGGTSQIMQEQLAEHPELSLEEIAALAETLNQALG